MSVSECRLLSLADSLVRTNISTCAAVYTLLRVNRVDIALRDSVLWAFADTSTASDTVIANYVSHSLVDLIVYNYSFFIFHTGYLVLQNY